MCKGKSRAFAYLLSLKKAKVLFTPKKVQVQAAFQCFQISVFKTTTKNPQNHYEYLSHRLADFSLPLIQNF